MLFVESIEGRYYMAATFKLSRGILSISGTAGDDAISVGAGNNAFQVVANGDTRTFNSSDVQLIRIYGGDGDDELIVSPRQKTSVLIEAGNGNDRVGGGSNNDTLLGLLGNDVLVGNAGNDYIDAGADDDVIDDRFGINVIHGGGGIDSASVVTRLGSGVEHVATYSSNGKQLVSESLPMATELRALNGRTILTYNDDIGGSTGDYADHSIVLRSDGQYEVRTDGHTGYAGGATHGEINAAWDVTRSLQQGLIFTYTEDTLGNGNYIVNYSVPFLLPR